MLSVLTRSQLAMRWLLVAVLLLFLFTVALASQSRGKKGKVSSNQAKGKGSHNKKDISNANSSDQLSVSSGRKGKKGDVVETLEVEVVQEPVKVRTPAPSPPASIQVEQKNPPPPTLSNGRKVFGISSRRMEVQIEPQRVIQIQKALFARGFYKGELTGKYDDATIEAMKQLQASEQIDVTGYPTAHALKRLGLN